MEIPTNSVVIHLDKIYSGYRAVVEQSSESYRDLYEIIPQDAYQNQQKAELDAAIMHKSNNWVSFCVDNTVSITNTTELRDRVVKLIESNPISIFIKLCNKISQAQNDDQETARKTIGIAVKFTEVYQKKIYDAQIKIDEIKPELKKNINTNAYTVFQKNISSLTQEIQSNSFVINQFASTIALYESIIDKTKATIKKIQTLIASAKTAIKAQAIAIGQTIIDQVKDGTTCVIERKSSEVTKDFKDITDDVLQILNKKTEGS